MGHKTFDIDFKPQMNTHTQKQSMPMALKNNHENFRYIKYKLGPTKETNKIKPYKVKTN
jgi:hypothetical protein